MTLALALALAVLAGSFAQSAASALRKRPASWPPRKTGVSVATLQETF